DDAVRIAAVTALRERPQKATTAIPELVSIYRLSLAALDKAVAAKNKPILDDSPVRWMPYEVLRTIRAIDDTDGIITDDLVDFNFGSDIEEFLPKWRAVLPALQKRYPMPVNRPNAGDTKSSLPEVGTPQPTAEKTRFPELEGAMFGGQPFEHWW